MRMGTHIKLADGRVGTVVYNSLIGVGIKWGLHNPPPEDFENTDGNTVSDSVPYEGWPWEPDALLRGYWPGCPVGLECVGENCEIIQGGIR